MAVDNALPEIDLSAAIIATLDYSFQAEADFETHVQDYLARNITAIFDREAAAMMSWTFPFAGLLFFGKAAPLLNLNEKVRGGKDP